MKIGKIVISALVIGFTFVTPVNATENSSIDVDMKYESLMLNNISCQDDGYVKIITLSNGIVVRESRDNYIMQIDYTELGYIVDGVEVGKKFDKDKVKGSTYHNEWEHEGYIYCNYIRDDKSLVRFNLDKNRIVKSITRLSKTLNVGE